MERSESTWSFVDLQSDWESESSACCVDFDEIATGVLWTQRLTQEGKAQSLADGGKKTVLVSPQEVVRQVQRHFVAKLQLGLGHHLK